MLMYGSTLIEVTSMPQQLSSVPKELAITPLPTPLITPPVTKMYFMAGRAVALLLLLCALIPRNCVTLTNLRSEDKREANVAAAATIPGDDTPTWDFCCYLCFEFDGRQP